jgi:hypothetical protein
MATAAVATVAPLNVKYPAAMGNIRLKKLCVCVFVCVCVCVCAVPAFCYEE